MNTTPTLRFMRKPEIERLQSSMTYSPPTEFPVESGDLPCLAQVSPHGALSFGRLAKPIAIPAGELLAFMVGITVTGTQAVGAEHIVPPMLCRSCPMDAVLVDREEQLDHRPAPEFRWSEAVYQGRKAAKEFSILDNHADH